MLRPGIYYLVREYKTMQLLVTGFEIVMSFLLFKLNESPRWQLTNGQFDKARKVILKAAAEKGELSVDQVESKLVRLKEFLDQDEESQRNAKNQNLLDMYRVPKLLKYCCLLYLMWFVMTLVTYGMSLNIGDLGGNLFVNSFALAVAATISRISIIFILDRFTRRRLLGLSYFGAAVSYMAMACLTSSPLAYMTSLALIGYCFLVSVIIINYLYATEIFPTSVRQIGVGSCSFVARFGSITAPFARELVCTM